MKLKHYELDKLEQEKLIKGIQASLAVPFIDSLEDYVWEAIFCYFKGIALVDVLSGTRKKYLFDIIDEKNHIGWSAKAVQCTIRKETEFELVIQRADIFKKQQLLGFENLSINSPTQELGNALLRHWQSKILEDSKIQNVKDKRICVLLKSHNRRQYAYLEEDLAIYSLEDLYWEWTDYTKTGLQGKRKSDNFCVYRWYPNQKQFFERFKLPPHSPILDVPYHRLDITELVELLIARLPNNA
jgi:hypothetical protein